MAFWEQWLAFVGKRSGPDLYLLIGIAAALTFVAGGELIGSAATVVMVGIVIASARAARREGVPAHEMAAGTGVCFACRASFPLGEMRRLSKYVALLGPSTWVARQNAHCNRCASRQEIMVATLILLFVGVGAAMLTTS